MGGISRAAVTFTSVRLLLSIGTISSIFYSRRLWQNMTEAKQEHFVNIIFLESSQSTGGGGGCDLLMPLILYFHNHSLRILNFWHKNVADIAPRRKISDTLRGKVSYFYTSLDTITLLLICNFNLSRLHPEKWALHFHHHWVLSPSIGA